MTDEGFMKLAIKEAKKSKETLKCGTVIVKGKRLIAKSFNSQRKDLDPTAHSEIKALRKAGKTTGNKNLTGCVVYSTCEPCMMCASAIIFAKISKLYYGVPLIETSKGQRIKLSTSEILGKTSQKFEVIGNFMETECRELYP